MKPRVLFLCTANSCRSQMAEGWLRALAGGRLEVLSAGTHPTHPHPLAIRVMAEAGVDLAGQHSKPLQPFLTRPPELVISVCSQAAARCVTDLPRAVAQLCWCFDDPALVTGTEAERLQAFRRVRDAIRDRIQSWIGEGLAGLPTAASRTQSAAAGSPPALL